MNTPSRRSFFKGTSLLGLRPIVNASGTYTHLGGSLMPPEVLEAMNDAARHYVPIRDLTKATGEEIARLTGVPGALVTTGAAGGIFVGTFFFNDAAATE